MNKQEYKPNQFTKKLEAHVKNIMGSSSPQFSRWYCGITNNINTRIVQHSKVKPQMNYLYCVDTKDHLIAKNTEKYITINLGTANARQSGNAKQDSTIVYIFKHNLNINKSLGTLNDDKELSALLKSLGID
jgi:hypothetical protein